MFYIVGLGNPGDKYKKTRHNVGRAILENLVETEMFPDWQRSKNANAYYSRGTIVNHPVELLLPETFMNQSGNTVQYVAEKHLATPEEFIVVHDDIDLPFGEIKVCKSRGAGGNNGVQSVIDALGSKDFARVRVGIAPKSFWTGKMKRPAGGGPLERFVLKPFTPTERKELQAMYKKVQIMFETIVDDGVDTAMNKYN